MSLSCSATCFRNRSSSSRSAGDSGFSPWTAAASMRRRSSATHRPRLSWMPSSRETSATVRPESITRWAASTLYSVVNDRRFRDMGTSFQQDR